MVAYYMGRSFKEGVEVVIDAIIFGALVYICYMLTCIWRELRRKGGR
jgi:hypothetical protein